MIEIFSLASGTMLDLAPDTAFEIEYDNPLFEDSHIPVPFSTAITFLPTDHNKQEFGLLDAMLLEPANKRIPVELYASGVKLLSGILIYEGIEDGGINYSFSGKSLEDDWSGKIWEKNIYQIPAGTATEHRAFFRNVLAGIVDGVYAPVLVNSMSAADTVVKLEESPDDGVDVAVKYHNCPLLIQGNIEITSQSQYSFFTPAIPILKVLETEFGGIDIDQAIFQRGQLNNLVILGQYKKDCAFTETSIPAEGIDVARMLPDITALELAQILAKIFCAAYYRDGDRFVLRSAEQILSAAPELDWDSQVSDNAELSVEAGAKYAFGFGNGADENVYDPAAASVSDGDIATYNSLADALQAMEDAYSAWKFALTGDIYSSMKVTPSANSIVDYPEGPDGPETGPIKGIMSDVLLHRLETFDLEPEDNGTGSFDNSVPANLVRCVPDTFFIQEGVIDGSHFEMRTVAAKFAMAAIVNAPGVHEDRGSEVYIGTIHQPDAYGTITQIADKGVALPASISQRYAEMTPNLDPAVLFEGYHKSFAQWVRTRRQVVVASLNLSMSDIANFRMWQKVMFRGRCWFVRKLTLEISASSDRVEATGEFVSI